MTTVDLSDVQGNLLRGYRMHFVAHVVARVADREAAQRFLSDSISGADDHPQITTEASDQWTTDSKPSTCLNVGVTAEGLRAFGMAEDDLQSFPHEFVSGPVRRARKVGDIDKSAPANWQFGLGEPDAAHVMWSVHGSTAEARDELIADLQSRWERSGAFEVLAVMQGAALPDPHRPGRLGDVVHFGYRDSISQPRFAVNGKTLGRPNGLPPTPVGALLQGYDETSFANVLWQLPKRLSKLSLNSCFNAFRVLEQDVVAFESFLEATAQERGWHKEFVAAKLMGRWRNGQPLVDLGHQDGEVPAVDYSTDSDQPPVDEATINNWDYADIELGEQDLEGRPCPLGAHIRRANPRGSRIAQRTANRTRPLVRRGMPYGPAFDPDKPDPHNSDPHNSDPDNSDKADGVKRGLLGNFFCGSLLAQYEAMMYDWINLGLQDPRITGTNDPIIGANDAATSRFDIRVDADTTVSLRGFPRFTQTRGSLYLWVPSITGIRHQATAR